MSKTPRPGALERRPRWIHWSAWFASVVSFATLLGWLLGPRRPESLAPLGTVDLLLSAAWTLEFFTRTGWRRSGLRYLAWRWFDVVAMLPILFLLDIGWNVPAAIVWFVLATRLVRATDRTLGDGFLLGLFTTVLEGVEEEISDRVILKITSRIGAELEKARFGAAASKALAANRGAILERIYEEQLKDGGLLTRVAQATGLRSALEKSEARVFDSILEILGSEATDQAIRAVIRETLGRATAEIGQKSWRKRLLMPRSAAFQG